MEFFFSEVSKYETGNSELYYCIYRSSHRSIFYKDLNPDFIIPIKYSETNFIFAIFISLVLTVFNMYGCEKQQNMSNERKAIILSKVYSNRGNE